MSPSSRRAWIEIVQGCGRHRLRHVALLAEGVDRNHSIAILSSLLECVALLAEGVDRNKIAKYYADLEQVVALLAEGVDRNKVKAA